MNNINYLFLFLSSLLWIGDAFAQFAPSAGVTGTTAIHKDSSVFIAWATGCDIARGWQDIADTSLGYATAGDSSSALGFAGENGVVSLGDGGIAVLTFSNPITNGNGWDFAIFENAFSDIFLELAFVEVSSDGANFFRFPPTSNTQDSIQIGGFGSIEATKINNLAGKYRALYGTPFDLEELIGINGLDINNISHVKIIDVVGCIQEPFATYDINGNKINDPWNTSFASGGFDLDAVGVIHQNTSAAQNLIYEKPEFELFPNPSDGNFKIEMKGNIRHPEHIKIYNMFGKIVYYSLNPPFASIREFSVAISTNLPDGVYFIELANTDGKEVKKFIVKTNYQMTK